MRLDYLRHRHCESPGACSAWWKDTIFSMWLCIGGGNEGKQASPCAKAPSDPSAAIYRTGMKALAVPWQNSFTRSFHYSSLRRKGKKRHTEHLTLLSHLPLSTFQQTPTFLFNPLLIRLHAMSSYSSACTSHHSSCSNVTRCRCEWQIHYIRLIK